MVSSIAARVKVPVQLGGGLRSLESIRQVITAGVQRVILGTIAVEQPDLVKAACAAYPEAVIVSIDARDGIVATRGWLQGTSVKAIELGKAMTELGVRRFIYTDIKRDGTLSGPNYAALTEMMKATGRRLSAPEASPIWKTSRN
jgi:phosphoribosylformimino-5-aminoimidazole carboxamide ribotide isomerase